jgi:ABC-2 type transport system ATP-binding protein
LSDADSSRLTTAELGKQFGDEWAVRDVNLRIDDLRVVGLVGPSGSGKTTLVRLLNGAIKPDAGWVRLLGRDPMAFSPRDQQRIGYLPQQPVLFPELSLWENLNFHASLAGVRYRRRKRLTELLDFVELGPDRRKKVHQASGGMQRRLALAATLVHHPEVLFLDEPTAGIDPILRRRIWDRLRELRDQGTLLIVTTQYVGEAAYCDDVGVISEGRLLSLSPPPELARGAYGGDVIDITTDDVLSPAAVAELQQLEGVVRIERPTALVTRVIASNGATTLEAIARWVEQHQLSSASVEQPPTDYDDVFVRVIERSRAAQAAGQAAS